MFDSGTNCMFNSSTNCMFIFRHLYSNFRKKFSGVKLKKTDVEGYNLYLCKCLKWQEVNEEALKHLIKNPQRFWIKLRFKTTPRCDTLVNNMLEAFNSILVTGRAKPIVIMFEDIRVYLMLRWKSNRHKIAKYEGNIL